MALRTPACEVAIKSYAAGDREDVHVHRVATEITAIVSGRVRMMGAEWTAGDILTIEPGEGTDFSCPNRCCHRSSQDAFGAGRQVQFIG